MIAVDAVAFKREGALSLDAARAVADAQEAMALAQSFTNGQGAAVAIVTVGVITGEHITQAFSGIRKQGTVVVTALGDSTAVGIPVPIVELALYVKTIKGSLFGSSNPRADIPRLLDLYTAGFLKPDELVTAEYSLDEINNGYEGMHAGSNIRGFIRF